ncbi:MAG TPA: class I SAM-dependent methyltransferase [Anaerolineales bacterium]|nr:class I SAM-dependent methyltransferase [Anaerolineales bacterium]
MNIQDSYNNWSDIYDTDANLTRDLDAKITRVLLANQHFDSILELGCGTGKNTEYFAKIGSTVHALDFSKRMIQKAKEKVKAKNVRFEMADLTKRWNSADDAYDLITCNLVLEHIEDLSHIFAEAARVLKPNRKFLVNELHPFKQYGGSKARFESSNGIIEVDAFVHHVSEFINAASENGLKLAKLNEYWHKEDEGRSPRLVSFMFEKYLG